MAGIVWQLFRLVPSIIEDAVETKLLENDVVVTEFPVEGVGLNGLQVGQGRLLVDSSIVSWESLWVGYSLGDLMAGRIDHLHFQGPIVTLQTLPPSRQPGTSPAKEPITTTVPQPVPPTSRPAPAEPSTKTVSTLPLPPPPPTLHDQLLELPLNELTGRNGVLEILIQEDSFLRFSLDGRLESQPYGVAGEVVLENDWMAAELSLRVPANQALITVQADAVMLPGAVREIQRRLVDIRPDLDNLPQVVSSGPFTIDLFLEIPEASSAYGSAEASIEELALRFAFLDQDLVLNRLLMAGILKDRQVSIRGGAEVLPMQIGSFRADTFSLRFSAKDPTEIDVETEAFNWNIDALSGRGAFRGSAIRDPAAGTFNARLEASLTALRFNELRADPFSILLETDGGTLRFKGSPVGLVRDGTIWVEDLAAQWDLAANSGNARFAWYNLSGKAMGSVEVQLSQRETDQMEAGFSLVSTSGVPFLAGTWGTTGDNMKAGAKGLLPVTWLNSLNKWGKVLPATLSGTDPGLEVQLSGPFPFLSGKALITLNGLGLELEGGTRLEDIRGNVALQVNLLPRAEVAQELWIKRVTGGGTVIKDVFVEWDMPHLRNIRIRQLHGLLTTGRIRVEPFEVDPMAPAFATVIHFEHMDGNVLLEMLGEKRFTIKGNVSGQLAVGWENDTLVIGKGSLAMDEANGDRRFLFTDQAFLKERFASFGGVPLDLKDRFLEALLNEGIRIESMTATLGPATETGKILLRISISGESRTDRLEVPIKGFVINNLISGEDLGQLMGLFGNLNIRTAP